MGVRSSKLSKLIAVRVGGSGCGRVKRLGRGPQMVTPRGHVPICVGVNDEIKHFMVYRKALGDTNFLELLYKSAEECGFYNQGVLRILYELKEFEDWMIHHANRKVKV